MRSRRAKIAILVVLLAAIAVAGGAGLLVERRKQTQQVMALTRGNPERAMQSIVRYGCAGYHTISGARMPGGLAAAPLSGVKDRVYIGGAVANTPDNLVRWIVNPKQFNPRNAMPVSGIGEDEARDVAAYLYLQR